MADNLSYSPSGHYLPSYYSSSQSPATGNALDLPAPLARPADTTQRRRPKYTRSKTGCMTCRQKKIKCDENKPKCHRCAHGQRDCTWPVGAEPRKRAPQKRVDSIHMDHPDVRPSTASSSGISEGSTSTPPTRHHTPPKRELTELDLPPLTLRRHGDLHGQPHHPHGHSMTSLMDPGHRSSLLPVSSGSQFHPPSSHSNLSVIPELSNSYLTLPPVDQLYTPAPQQQYSSSAPLGGVPRVAQTSGSGYRYYENMQSMSHWMPQAPSHLEPMDPYFSHTQDRFPAGTSSSDTQPSRYH